MKRMYRLVRKADGTETTCKGSFQEVLDHAHSWSDRDLSDWLIYTFSGKYVGRAEYKDHTLPRLN